MRSRPSRCRGAWALLLLALVALDPLHFSQSASAAGDHAPALSADEAAYRAAMTGRAASIVEKLRLESGHADRVTVLVAEQYRSLRDAHAARDRAVAAADEAEKPAARDAAAREIDALHRRFVARLGAELEPAQVDAIKDGMTYGVVPITLAAYDRLLPGLTEEQRREVRANLLEAREYAMDAGSSEEKHGWFGKYKGRINNFLSAAGYDLKQAEKDLAARR